MTPNTLPTTQPPTQPPHNTPENAPALLTDEKKNIDFEYYATKQKRRILKSLDDGFFYTAKAHLDELIITEEARNLREV